MSDVTFATCQLLKKEFSCASEGRKEKKKSKLRFGPEDENVGLEEKTVKGYTDFTIK